jgi:hypothetical protein
MLGDPGFDVTLAVEIEVAAGNGEERAVQLLPASYQRRAHHAAVAGNPNALARQVVRTLMGWTLCRSPGPAAAR